MKKLLQKLPLGAMLLSLLFTLYAIAGWAGASMPYQDAPQALLLQQQAQIAAAENEIAIGILAFVVSTAVWIWRRKR